MAKRRPKAPTGCYWRGDTLWGRVRKAGGPAGGFCFSLHTGDPAIARQRFEAQRQSELSEVFTVAGRNSVKNYVNHWRQRRITVALNWCHSSKINGLHSFLQGFLSDAFPFVLATSASAFTSVLAGHCPGQRPGHRQRPRPCVGRTWAPLPPPWRQKSKAGCLRHRHRAS
jgi:hypothetical protein